MTMTTPYSDQDIAAAIARGRAAAHDRPQPGLDAGSAAQEYAAMAQEFRASAWERLEQGDMDHRHPRRRGSWLRKRSRPSARTMAV